MRHETKQVLMLLVPWGLALSVVIWILAGSLWIWLGVMTLISVQCFLSGALEASTKYAEMMRLHAAVREIVEESQNVVARNEEIMAALAERGIEVSTISRKQS